MSAPDDDTLNIILRMGHSLLGNYVLPGLTSLKIGGLSDTRDFGTVRMFCMSREHLENITPHSHRYDFACMVLRGTVVNHVWRRVNLGEPGDPGDMYAQRQIDYGGRPGAYRDTNHPLQVDKWTYESTVYDAGEWYRMTHDQIHHITFDRDATVLFFQGPDVTNTTSVLLPFVNGGEVIETMKVQPWMFRKAG